VTGLRGAADASGDGKVSLNELYHYAYNETLARTEFSVAGPQHPSYNFTLVGSGDLVMTDIAAGDAVLILDSVQDGKFFVRTTGGTLVAEVNKVFGTSMALALPAGKYVVSCVTAGWTAQCTIQLKSGERFRLERSDFTEIIPETTRRRGTGDEAAAEEISAEETGTEETEDRWTPFYISLVPGVSFPWGGNYSANISASLLAGRNNNITGIQANGFYGHITGNLSGVQASGFMSIIDGKVTGVQTSGFMNIARGEGVVGIQDAGFLNINNGYIHGVQAAGFMNINNGGFIGIQGAGFMTIMQGHGKGVQAAGFLNIADRLDGVQLGIINVANELNGAPIGFLNFIKGGICSPAVYVDSLKNLFLQYQGGTEWFYTFYFVGTPWDFKFDELVYGGGFGARLKLGRMLSFDFDISTKQYLNIAKIEELHSKDQKIRWEDIGSQTIPGARVSLNVSLFKRLSVFCGVSADLIVEGYNDKYPAYKGPNASFTVNDTTCKLYPTFFAGLKF
jgi:hypothetical protein